MPRGRPRKNPDAVLVKSAEMIGWAIGGIEREIMATRERLDRSERAGGQPPLATAWWRRRREGDGSRRRS